MPGGGVLQVTFRIFFRPGPQRGPRGAQEVPKGTKKGSRGSPGVPKREPRRPRRCPREPTRGPRGAQGFPKGSTTHHPPRNHHLADDVGCSAKSWYRLDELWDNCVPLHDIMIICFLSDSNKWPTILSPGNVAMFQINWFQTRLCRGPFRPRAPEGELSSSTVGPKADN